MQRGRKLSEISIHLLKMALKTGELTAEMLTSIPPEFVSRGAYRVGYRYADSMARHGYLKKNKTKSNRSFFLTTKGRDRILQILHMEKLMSGKWDGKWRVIIFDIPEDLKKWRDYLRNNLKELGFYHLQDSVYITPYPVTGELDQLLKEWGLRKYFRYLTVTEIDNEDKLKKFFGLK